MTKVQEIYNYAQSIITLLTPFVLIYITYRISKKEKENARYRELREENEALEKKIADNKQRERDQAVKSLQKDMAKVKQDMSDLKETISEEVANKMTCALNDLLKLNNVNLAYCQSLSCLITTIGEEMKDKNPDGGLAKAIVEHQKKERELFASIVKSSC